MAQNEKDNIIRHPRRLPVTFVGVVFGMILVYLIIQGVLFLTRDKVQAYNIGAAGSDSVTGTFRGMILREENCVAADDSGYLSYYASSGERLKAGALACTIDQTGGLEDRLHLLYSGKDVLPGDSRRRIREAINTASENYDPVNFSESAGARTSIRAAVLNSLLEYGGESVDKLIGDEHYTEQRTAGSGFILLWQDGYEGCEVTSLRSSDFLPENYKGSQIRVSGEKVKRGDFVYKTAPDNKFRIVFVLSEYEKNRLADKINLTIRLTDGTQLRGAFSIGELADRTPAGIITFQKFGGNYLNSRFIDFQVLDTEITGYKIPESAIVQKSFFVVDRSFITSGGNTSQNGLLAVQDDGEPVFIPATVYMTKEGEDSFIIGGSDTAYVYSSELHAGMRIISASETGLRHEETTLGVTASVEGVYQINQGYCIFKPVLRLANSLDTSYTVIASGMRYGLQAYDRILMDGSAVGENDFIFE
ncbi:MAG: hypothetical protein IKR59_09535 [Lachnospiraceae bacterium]|nr:hypothetical protein [Lachnospiraceae bacterium]